MAVNIQLRQDNRQNAEHPGYWYAHSVNNGTINGTELAEVIQRNCSLKRSDVVAVLTELAELTKQFLQSSHRVHLDGIGSLMVGVNGRGVSDPANFRPSRDITGLHLTFLPEKVKAGEGRPKIPRLLDGCKVRKG